MNWFIWLLENPQQVWLIIAQVIAVASVIVKVTPNSWDDNILSKILQFLALVKKPATPEKV